MIYSLMAAFDRRAGQSGRAGRRPPYAVGMTLFTRYILPVELVAVLLLVALIGALLVARQPQRRDRGSHTATLEATDNVGVAAD